MSRLCPEYDPSRSLIEPLLFQVDCRLENYVEAGHQGLFGQFGALNGLLTTAFTILVAFYGLRLLIGNAQLRISDISIKLLFMGIVIMITTDWEIYHLLMFDVFYNSGTSLAGMLGDFVNNGTRTNIAASLDDLLVRGMRVANTIQTENPLVIERADTLPENTDEIGGRSASNLLSQQPNLLLLWSSLIIITLFSAGTLVIAKILMGVLLMVGPLSAIFLLFSFTRDLFMGWLRLVTIFSVMPLFVTLFAYGLVEVAVPILTQLESQFIQTGQKLQLTVALLLLSVIFSALVLLSLFACNSLTSGWHWPKSGDNKAETHNDDKIPTELQTALSASTMRINGMIGAIQSHGEAISTSAAPARSVVFEPSHNTMHSDMHSLQVSPQRHSSIANAFRSEGRTGS